MPPRWREQYDRVKRWHDRLPMSSAEHQIDDFYAFFTCTRTGLTKLRRGAGDGAQPIGCCSLSSARASLSVDPLLLTLPVGREPLCPHSMEGGPRVGLAQVVTGGVPWLVTLSRAFPRGGVTAPPKTTAAQN